MKTKRYKKNVLIKTIIKKNLIKTKNNNRNKNTINYGKYNNFISKGFYLLIIIIIIQLILNVHLFKRIKHNVNNNIDDIELNYIKVKFEEIEPNILLQIQDKLEGIIEMEPEERKFFNGVIRKYRPKKVVEIGVAQGGSSALILNAIKDIPNAKLFSIDRSNVWYKDHSKKVGWLVKERFKYLMDKWTLYTDINTAEVIETIGNNIDLVLIDTVHATPGEMLNWLEVLPFLKEEAIVVFHDTYLMFYKNFITRNIINYSNNQLFNYIRGKLILPTYGDKTFKRNIGALKLYKNQKKFYKLYFLALGTQWQYFPSEKDMTILKEYFKKYYGEELTKIYNDAIEQNKERFK